MAQIPAVLTIGGTIEDRYEILRLLGEGGMGRVYLVRDRKRPDYFAVKCLKSESGLDPHHLLQFVAEAELWAGLGTHPHVVQLMSINRVTESHPLIFLEYVDGKSLRGILEQSHTQPPILRVLDYAIQLCGGMAHAHAKGVVHRDLKPDNILVSLEGIKITDFGIATVLRSISTDSAVGRRNGALIAGTLPYMSIEQLAVQEDLNAATDVYSFGVMLYELVAGHRPFRGTTVEELRRAQRASRPVAPSTFSQQEVPLVLDRAIMACLSLEASERPDFASLSQLFRAVYDRELASLAAECSHTRWTRLERAVALNNQRQSREAIAVLTEVIEEDPRDFNAWHLMGNAFMDIGQSQMPAGRESVPTVHLYEATASHRKAIRCAERSTELNPQHAWAWNTQGACLMAIGYFNMALQRLDKAIDIDPSYPVAWRTRSICLRKMGRLSDALASFDHALVLEPHNANALNGKGVCLGLLERHPEALACFDQALTVAPYHIQALSNRRLWAEIAAGNADKIAIVTGAHAPDVDEYLKRLLHIRADNRKGGRAARDLEAADLADRAWGLMNVGLLRGAEKVSAEAITVDPTYSTAWLQRGKILRRMGYLSEAVAAFEKTLEIDAQYALAMLNEGLALVDMDRLDHALDLFDQYIAVEPDDTAGWNNQGLVFMKQEKYQNAIGSFTQAIRIEPTFSMGWFNKAQAHLLMGQIDDAYVCCEQGLRSDPLSLGGLFVLGQTELCCGHTEAALVTFRRVTELDPTMAGGWGYRAAVETNVEAVMSCCQQAEQLGFKDKQWLLVAAGRALLLAKRPKDALDVYKKLVEMNPGKRAYGELKAVCEWQLQLHQELDSLGSEE